MTSISQILLQYSVTYCQSLHSFIIVVIVSYELGIEVMWMGGINSSNSAKSSSSLLLINPRPLYSDGRVILPLTCLKDDPWFCVANCLFSKFPSIVRVSKSELKGLILGFRDLLDILFVHHYINLTIDDCCLKSFQ